MTFEEKKYKKKMEEIAFSDWPGQPVDLNAGNNPWQPAYGFQTPTTLLEKEDFIGNPDAEYFLHGNSGHYMYLETIQEETSDDLRSESDLESRGSPVGWLATDSEAGSVICMETNDEIDCESDRELACPPKRRKQDCFLVISDDEVQSLSRSSSLLQFETLEKQCQEISNSSPSIYSFDSLEVRKLSPDSLDNDENDENLSNNNNNEYYKSLKIDLPLKKDYTSRDSLLYNVTIRYNSDGNSDSSDDTLAASHSLDNLKTWRSYDSLQQTKQKPASKEKISVENLSEDSGYSDQIIKMKPLKLTTKKQNNTVGFSAYDGDVFNNQFQGNFGVSYQDLSIFDEVNRISPLVDIFMRNKRSTNNIATTKIDLPEILKSESKYNCDSAPNLMHISDGLVLVDTLNSSSVPKDLNLISNDDVKQSIAIKNYDITDLIQDYYCDISETDMAQSYKREGSYSEAMLDRVDLSDDEHSLCYKKKLPKTTIVEFDKKVLKAISEQSLQSLVNSNSNLSSICGGGSGGGGGETNFLTSTPKRDSAVSTPNLALMRPYFEIGRKDSLIKSSTSTSGMSDIEDMKMTSSNTKGVHFSPVVSEANWPQRDSSSVSTTVTLERESSYNLSSDELTPPPTPKLIKPKCNKRPPTPSNIRARSMSQPELSDSESTKQEFIDSLKNLQKNDVSKSQPDVSRFKRRGSQLIKKDKDGCIIKAYVDGDGIQYKHTHLDLNIHRSNEIVGAISNPTLVGSRTTFQSNSSITSGYAGCGGGITTTNSTSNIEQLQHIRRQQYNNINTNKSVGAMEAFETHHQQQQQNLNSSKSNNNINKQTKSSASGKIGGFFSRLASFRFSARKNAEEKNKIKKKNQTNHSVTGGVSVQSQQRIATKDDYIYIPLKSPTTTTIQSNLNNNLNNGKPPLPKQPPPRIVHVKQKLNNNNNNNNALASIGRCVVDDDDVTVVAALQPPPPRHRHRRRTIDSGQPMEPMGLIETDLDTEVTVITSGPNVKTRSLLNLGCEPHHLTICGGGGGTTNITGGEQSSTGIHQGQQNPTQRPHKSMEFLLDKQNLKVVEPPENELQKTERVMSEHQLRVQRSLQKLTVPDWYKQAQIPREGFLLKKHSQRDGNNSRWTGTTSGGGGGGGGSKTTSLNSLTTSPLILSPTPCSNQQPFVRWSTSKLNSTASSPCASTRSSFNARQPNGSISPSSVRSSFSYRQPYLGWRSQERLTRPRTPAERLASTILAQASQPQQQQQQQPQECPEIQTSIKEVTSAIVHYVSGLRPDEHNRLYADNDSQTSQRSLSVSPRGSQKFCWLESSFVGTKPLDSPQTPITLTESQNSDQQQQEQQQQQQTATVNLRLDLQTHNDVTLLTTATTTSVPTCGSNNKPSPSSTTLEDVLDSLLGLPSSGRAPSPSLQGRRPVDGVS